MLKQIALSVLLAVTLYALQAQNPVAPILEGELGKPRDTRLKLDPCTESNAGTIAAFEPQGNFQSNDIMRDTIFLCFGDQLLINHAEDFDTGGDPRPATEGGISYIFYNDRPTVDGPDLANIATDPAAIPNPLDPNNPVLMNANTSRDADVLFGNNGLIQDQFSNGFPVVLWFAPVTVDAFTEIDNNGTTLFVPTYEDDPTLTNDPVGPCVSVSIDEAFAVAFLNNIQENGVGIDPTTLTGTFRIGGGFPQVDPTGTYDITITKSDDASVQGTIANASISHSDEVEFSVPELGLYTVTVEDGKSCPHTFEINFIEGVTFEFSNLNIPSGGSGCVDFRVQDFTDISSFQFPLIWDALPIRFDSISNVQPDLEDFIFFNEMEVDFGRLVTNWADVATFQPLTFDDGTILFSLCFTARGDEGDCSTLDFDQDANLSIEVTDPNGQPLPLNLVPGQICISNQPFDVVVDKTDIPCTDDGTVGTGSITFTPSNGAAPYRYELIDTDNTVVTSGDNVQDGETVTIDGLEAGDYDLVLFDQTSNTGSIPVFTEEVTINQASNFGVNIESKFVPISCFGFEDGAAIVEITESGVEVGNPQGYSYLWNNGDTTRLIRDIGAGDYIVTVTKDGCSKIAAASISQPDSITLSINSATKNATCDGINDGLVVFDVTGGFTEVTDSFSFQWNFTGVERIEAGITISAGALPAGEYFLTVTDDNGCQQFANTELFFDKQITVSPNLMDVTCFGGNDGEINISASTIPASDEFEPYSFTWETDLGDALPNDTNNSTTISNIGANTYILEIEDNTVVPGFEPFRCIFRDTFEIVEPEQIELNFMADDASCGGGLMDGIIQLDEPIGGTAPFSYVWDSLPDVTGRIADNLSPGEYKVVITDANNCQDSLDFVIGAPDLPTITGIDTARLNCSSDMNGQLTVMFELGSSMAQITDFDWSNGDDEQTTTATLGEGEYTIRITDQNGCFTEGVGVVLAPDPLMLDTIINTSPTCPGFNNGSISVVPIGGTEPYAFTLNGNPSGGATFPSLLAGTYEVMVTDANNCPPLNETIVVEEPPSILVSFTDVQGTDCAEGQGGCTGSATATAILSNGEQRTFDFQWVNSGEQSINTVMSTAMSLCSGLDTLIVTDDGLNGCSVSVPVEIPSPPALIPVLDNKFISCFGVNDGGATATALGGTPGYRFLWSNNTTGEEISDLAPGSYMLTVIDANECTAETTLNLIEPDSLVVSIEDATSTVTCAGDEDGFIELGIEGGNGLGGSPFNWSDGVAGERDTTATDLGPGTYFVTVTDQNGCMDSISYTIGEPTPILAIIPTPDEPLCFGFQTSISVSDASGGAGGPYSFSVNNLNTVTLANSIPVFGGQEHLISVFDVRGCSFDTTIFVNQPPPVEVNLPAEIEVQLGDSIRLRPDVFSVVPIDTSMILWTPDEFLSITNELNPIVKPLDSRNYTLTLADLNGCTGEASVLIDVNKRRNVYIPNVIAPNSVQNSQFQVFTGLGVRKMNFMRIYDRWGELVYELGESDTSIGGIGSWNGTLNGKPLPSGVYVYIVEMEFIDEAKLLYRGDVTVIR
ncbi:MAG: gliding motility-associated C-terminal domain-containing protein [Bacteroidota bacterium]